MGKRKEAEKQSAPEPQQVTPVVVEETKSTRYVVLRDGYRVSDKEYETQTDPVCVSEVEFWTKVSKNHSYGEKVETMLYDSKKHRIW